KLTYKIVHSSTFLLPEWKQKLIDLKLPVRMMPRDVLTRWNSTFDMLEFAMKYWQALDAMTDTQKLGLGTYKLDAVEWMLVEQLCKVLKV
ncbi:hypothetical protein BDR05DRAFT_850932, partial [Suillus weaverae]